MTLKSSGHTTGSSIADNATDSVTLSGLDGADDLYVLIDNGSGGDHSGYELLVEVDTPSAGGNGFKEYTTVGGDGTNAETARSWRFPAVGRKMKLTLTNRSGGTASHSLDAYAEG